MDRRAFLGCGALAGAGALAGGGECSRRPSHRSSSPRSSSTRRRSPELQKQMAVGQRSSRQITEAYLARIAALDRRGPELRSVIETNPDALAIAAALDARAQAPRAPRGPLHGIPMLRQGQRRHQRQA